MEDQEKVLHLLGALRQRSPAALGGIERIAKGRLRDLPPRQWPQDIVDIYAQAGKTLSNRWNLSSLEDIGWLLTDLERRHKQLVALDKATWTQEERNVLRWFPAVLVLRHCFLIRERGCAESYIYVLQVSALSMWDYERRIGARRRKVSTEAAANWSNTRRWASKEPLRKVAEHLASMERSGRRRNVCDAVSRVGRELQLSATKVRNLRTLWYRRQRNLLPSAGR